MGYGFYSIAFIFKAPDMLKSPYAILPVPEKALPLKQEQAFYCAIFLKCVPAYHHTPTQYSYFLRLALG